MAGMTRNVDLLEKADENVSLTVSQLFTALKHFHAHHAKSVCSKVNTPADSLS